MKKFLHKIFQGGLLSAALILPLPALAVEWSVGVGGDAYWFDWREYSGDEELLLESGPMFLGRADVRMQASDFYTSLALALGGGAAQYDGQLQNRTPYQADAWESMLEAELQVGLQQSWGNAHLGLMQRNWDRQIDGTATVSSVHELYRWTLLTVGGEVQLFAATRWSAALAMDAGIPVKSWQRVYSGFFGDFNLEPGDGYFWRLAVPLRSRRLEFSPFVQYQTMDVSDSVKRTGSDGVPYTIVQPESTRLEGGLRVRYVFGSHADAARSEPDAPPPESGVPAAL